jgi:hypothetical protein
MTRTVRSRINDARIEQLRLRQTPALGLLKATGILDDLCSACAILERKEQGSVKGVSLAISWDRLHEAVENAIRRFAEEQCLIAEAARGDDALVVSLRLAVKTEGGNGGT